MNSWCVRGSLKRDYLTEFLLIAQLNMITVVESSILYSFCGTLRILNYSEVSVIVAVHPNLRLKKFTAYYSSNRCFGMFSTYRQHFCCDHNLLQISFLFDRHGVHSSVYK